MILQRHLTLTLEIREKLLFTNGLIVTPTLGIITVKRQDNEGGIAGQLQGRQLDMVQHTQRLNLPFCVDYHWITTCDPGIGGKAATPSVAVHLNVCRLAPRLPG